MNDKTLWAPPKASAILQLGSEKMNYQVLTSTENLPYEDWLEYRKRGIGGSDASVVYGINRYKSPVETAGLEPVNSCVSDSERCSAIASSIAVRLLGWYSGSLRIRLKCRRSMKTRL